MRLTFTAMSAVALGVLGCAARVPANDDSGTDETASNDDYPECLEDSDCPANWVCISQMWCEQTDSGPCDLCSAGEACIEDACEPIQGLPACAAIEVTSTETFLLPGEIGDFALAELDGEPGLELVGVSLTQAIAWIDGAAVESTLALADGDWLEVISLRANLDEANDLIVAVPPAHRLYQILGDGAGGFAFDFERNYGAKTPSDVARLRTGSSVDGMAMKLTTAEHQLHFEILTNNLPHQIIEGSGVRAVVDLDGNEVDEILIGGDASATIWRYDGELFVEAAQLSSSLELPSKDPWTEIASCDNFAAGDLDGDVDVDLVCMIGAYADSPDHGVLVPFFQTGELVFARGEPTVVESGGSLLRFFDLDGDGSPELLLNEAVVDIGPDGTFSCSSPHALGFGEVGNLDADAADELVSWGAPQAPYIHDLSW
jgi:hypothetical protein